MTTIHYGCADCDDKDRTIASLRETVKALDQDKRLALGRARKLLAERDALHAALSSPETPPGECVCVNCECELRAEDELARLRAECQRLTAALRESEGLLRHLYSTGRGRYALHPDSPSPQKVIDAVEAALRGAEKGEGR